MSDTPKSFFQTIPGILTGLASLVAAITGLWAATDGFQFMAKEATKTVQVEPIVKVSDQEHQQQLSALKRQKELDDLRLSHEKQKLLAEQELAKLREAASQLDIILPAENTQVINTVDISGQWYLTNAMGTFTFVLQQSGSNITLQEFDSMGNNVGNGHGSIEQNYVYLSWVEPLLFVLSLDVEAELMLSADRRTLVGTMSTDENTVPLRLVRN